MAKKDGSVYFFLAELELGQDFCRVNPNFAVLCLNRNFELGGENKLNLLQIR